MLGYPLPSLQMQREIAERGRTLTRADDPPAGLNQCQCGGTLTRDGRIPDGRQRWRCRGKCKRYELRRYEPELHECGICDTLFEGTAVQRYCSDKCKAAAKRKTARDLRAGKYGKIENARRRKKRASRATTPRGECKVCQGPVGYTNKIGICTRNPKCAKQHRQVHDRGYDAVRRESRSEQSGKPARIRRGYPAHPWELAEDGIVDYTAVEIATRGTRHVRLTPTEQQLVIERMLRFDPSWKELCNHLGIGSERLTAILALMGYEVLREPSAVKYQNRRLITRMDRPRGPKLLTPETPELRPVA